MCAKRRTEEPVPNPGAYVERTDLNRRQTTPMVSGCRGYYYSGSEESMREKRERYENTYRMVNSEGGMGKLLEAIANKTEVDHSSWGMYAVPPHLLCYPAVVGEPPMNSVAVASLQSRLEIIAWRFNEKRAVYRRTYEVPHYGDARVAIDWRYALDHPDKYLPYLVDTGYYGNMVQTMCAMGCNYEDIKRLKETLIAEIDPQLQACKEDLKMVAILCENSDHDEEGEISTDTYEECRDILSVHNSPVINYIRTGGHGGGYGILDKHRTLTSRLSKAPTKTKLTGFKKLSNGSYRMEWGETDPLYVPFILSTYPFTACYRVTRDRLMYGVNHMMIEPLWLPLLTEQEKFWVGLTMQRSTGYISSWNEAISSMFTLDRLIEILEDAIDNPLLWETLQWSYDYSRLIESIAEAIALRISRVVDLDIVVPPELAKAEEEAKKHKDAVAKKGFGWIGMVASVSEASESREDARTEDEEPPIAQRIAHSMVMPVYGTLERLTRGSSFRPWEPRPVHLRLRYRHDDREDHTIATHMINRVKAVSDHSMLANTIERMTKDPEKFDAISNPILRELTTLNKTLQDGHRLVTEDFNQVLGFRVGYAHPLYISEKAEWAEFGPSPVGKSAFGLRLDLNPFTLRIGVIENFLGKGEKAEVYKDTWVCHIPHVQSWIILQPRAVFQAMLPWYIQGVWLLPELTYTPETSILSNRLPWVNGSPFDKCHGAMRNYISQNKGRPRPQNRVDHSVEINSYRCLMSQVYKDMVYQGTGCYLFPTDHLLPGVTSLSKRIQPTNHYKEIGITLMGLSQAMLRRVGVAYRYQKKIWESNDDVTMGIGHPIEEHSSGNLWFRSEGQSYQLPRPHISNLRRLVMRYKQHKSGPAVAGVRGPAIERWREATETYIARMPEVYDRVYQPLGMGIDRHHGLMQGRQSIASSKSIGSYPPLSGPLNPNIYTSRNTASMYEWKAEMGGSTFETPELIDAYQKYLECRHEDYIKPTDRKEA